MAAQADNSKMKLIGVAVGVLLLAIVGYFFLGSDARATPQTSVNRSSQDVADDTLAGSSDVPTRGSAKRDGNSSRSRVQGDGEAGEDQLDEEEPEIKSKKKSAKKRPKRRPKRRKAEEEDEEEGASGTAASPPRPF